MCEWITTVLDFRKDFRNFSRMNTVKTIGLDHQADHEKRDEETNEIKPEG